MVYALIAENRPIMEWSISEEINYHSFMYIQDISLNGLDLRFHEEALQI